jgi:hypothetical protein
VPLRETMHVKGMVKAPLRQELKIPLRQTVHPKIAGEVQALVRLEGGMPARLEGELEAEVQLADPLRARIGELRFGAREVAVELR